MRSRQAAKDAISTLVGERGSRVKQVVEALGGERLDIILWNDSPEAMVFNALQPARIEQVRLDPARHVAVAVVADDEQLSLAGAEADQPGTGEPDLRLGDRGCDEVGFNRDCVHFVVSGFRFGLL